MFRTYANAFKIPELRKKLLITALVLLLYRIGSTLPVPFTSAELMSQYMTTGKAEGSLFSFFSFLSGNAFSQATLFALGVSPYITASIVVQLLAVAFPKIAGVGDEGKKRMQTITRYITVGISIVTAIGYYMILDQANALISDADLATYHIPKFFCAVVIVACFCAGSSLVMWLGEKINEHGIGNGISLILFANIVSSVPSALWELAAKISPNVGNPLLTKPEHYFSWGGLIFTLCVIIGMSALIWLIIYVSDSERRIPVQYAKKVVGRKMYGGQNTNLPIKLNMTGVMPIIFANAIVSIPSTIAMFVTPAKDSGWYKFFNMFTINHWVYAVLSLLLIIGFAYFYSAISFNPVEVASNMQKNGGSIPGVRPGKPTADFISKVVKRITFIGALYLAVVAVLPIVAQLIINIFDIAGKYSIQTFAFGGSSIIIVVGVILETAREIEAQMTMRHYKGFLD
ncbi:MAG: preprotein translocase subunit SecY [Clostridia bacterium]|nr:preprotein translocase subunit SecY [Clostridia bacterium]